MINISGIPNMGFAGGGGGYFAPSGLGQLGIGDISAYNKMPGIGADQALYNNIFGNFGQQTDYFSGLGAAYGRATGGFGAPGSNPGWQDPGAATPGYDPFSPGYGGQGAGMGSLFDQGAKSGSLGSMGMFGGYAPGVQPGAMDFSQLWGGRIAPQAPPVAQPVEDVNSWFNQLYGGGGGGNAYPLGGYGGYDPFTPGYGGQGAGPSGGGGGQAPQMPNIQALLGYNPAASAQFAPQQNPSPFFGAFSQFPGNATPSQYISQPYTNTQGQTFQPNMPQGFAPQFDVDNPQGALPLGWTSPFGNNSQAGG